MFLETFSRVKKRIILSRDQKIEKISLKNDESFRFQRLLTVSIRLDWLRFFDWVLRLSLFKNSWSCSSKLWYLEAILLVRNFFCLCDQKSSVSASRQPKNLEVSSARGEKMRKTDETRSKNQSETRGEQFVPITWSRDADYSEINWLEKTRTNFR